MSLGRSLFYYIESSEIPARTNLKAVIAANKFFAEGMISGEWKAMLKPLQNIFKVEKTKKRKEEIRENFVFESRVG